MTCTGQKKGVKKLFHQPMKQLFAMDYYYYGYETYNATLSNDDEEDEFCGCWDKTLISTVRVRMSV